MSEHQHTTWQCDKCRKELPTFHNSVNIVTTLSDSGFWSRLHVQIIHVHGVHNDVKSQPADLCQACAITLLTDALARVQLGERASAGTEAIEQGRWWNDPGVRPAICDPEHYPGDK